ncbi:hypothetical protein [Bartonella henselae]|nr:hypothetical protein [Bartonella henselae]
MCKLPEKAGGDIKTISRVEIVPVIAKNASSCEREAKEGDA